jgi:hypothetical protein
MKKALAIAAALALVAGVALGQVHYEFHCLGTGNMHQDSPPVYLGEIDTGDLSPGDWTITIDDTGWPSTSDPVARWAYLQTTYYDYDPINDIFTASFTNCDLWLSRDDNPPNTGGTMSGTCDMTFQIIDMNGNGQIDPTECMNGLSGAVIIIEDGTGVYSHLCGDGTYEGFWFRDCNETSPDFGLDNVDFNMQLDLEDCGMASDAVTWGAVKSLFD